MSFRSASIARVFDRMRAEDVFESIYILYIIAAIAMWALDVWAMVESELKSGYWAASIVSGLCLSIQAAVAIFLYKKMKTYDNDESSTKIYMNAMKLQDVMSVITAIVCFVAIITAGWLGFSYVEHDQKHSDVENDSTSPLLSAPVSSNSNRVGKTNKEHYNGKIAAVLMGLNLLGEVMAGLAIWANYKFRAYLRTRPGFLTPEQYETHVMTCASI